jgi:hypothetical protein
MWSDPTPKLKGYDQYCLVPITNRCAAQDKNNQPYTKASCEGPGYVWNAQGNCCYMDVSCASMDPAKCTARGGVVNGCDG